MLLTDIRYALRGLWLSKGFATVAILCLAFGIGLTTTIFSIVDGVLLKPYPYADADRLRVLGLDNPPQEDYRNWVSYLDIKDWKAVATSFEAITPIAFRTFTVTDGAAEPQRYSGALVSWDLFPILGVKPVVGQGFTAEHDQPNDGGVVLISHALWSNRYQRDPNVVGRVIQVNGVPSVILGVMPERFEFPETQKLWVPLTPFAFKEPRGTRSLMPFAKLKPGVTDAQADAELKSISRRLAAQYPDTNKDWEASMRTLRDEFIPPDVKSIILLMMAGVTLVLFIACSNVANLQLARASARRREISVRAALGAERRRIVTQLLTESVVLALVSVPLGLVLAQLGSRTIFDMMPPDDVPYYITWQVDWRSFVFSVLVATGTAVLFGLAPSLQATRGNLHADLKEGTRGNSVRSSPLRSGLVIAQLALAAVSLIGALLFVQTFSNLDTFDVGFDTAPLMTFRFGLQGDQYRQSAARLRKVEDVVKRVEATPGVTFAAASSLIPVSGGGNGVNIVVDGRSAEPGQEPSIDMVGVTSHFHRTLGLSMRAGRDFTDAEGWSELPVAVVNETMARRYWPDRPPIGGRFRIAGESAIARVWFEVIGVAPDIQHDEIEPGNQQYPVAYVPYSYNHGSNPGLIVRTSGPPAGITSAVRQQIREAEPNSPISEVFTMNEVRQRGYWQYVIFGWVFGTIGIVGLLLAAIGVYGVLSYAVNQRTPEIGVRIALGAGRPSVLWLVVAHGMWLAGIGVVAGLILAAATMGFTQEFMFEINPYDPIVFSGVALFLLAVAFLASALPALRATKVDPLVALRGE
jgi:putative ABC transport system permease protein